MNSRKKKNDNIQVIEKTAKKRYSLLTFVLLVCIAELAYSLAGNVNKNLHFLSKIKGLEQKLDEEKYKNEQLKLNIENYDSKSALEAITRNSLKMAGENEILLIIHKPQELQEKDRSASVNSKRETE